ncbi:MAG: M50 family metallopeptidase [Candidatus Dojkabacteria bacterium]
MTILVNILLLLLVISLLTFIHELGHFLAAKIVGAKVFDFSVGFGPKIFSKRIGDTTYNLRVLPFGGFVKILGDGDPTEKKEDLKDKGNLKNKSKLSQIFVMLAGVSMNMLLAVVLYTVFLSSSAWRLNITSEYKDFDATGADVKIERVSDLPYELLKEGGAVESGMYEKGYIKSVNGESIDGFVEFKEYLSNFKEKVVDLEVCSEDLARCEIFPTSVDKDGRVGMYIGENYSVFIDYSNNKIFSGFAHSVNVLRLTGKVLGTLLSQARQSGDYSTLSNTVSGPVGIYFVVDYFKTLGIFVFLGIIADLSLSLAIINLFPIPALDGGRAMILLIESIVRRDLNEKVESIIINISFVFLILLIIAIMFKDIFNIKELQSWFR